ncbi:LPS export ABC transporter periplasmic protein LptC [Croceicoccus marinus]|uniref:LPS export ABC transporter periplasmic protein LptC n=1 Tax=Croceicoccus marinus TaxID=450378 RepID=A0A1Z1FD84_9SPHN|nr:LPS export ABC transporter periplasmic protein LptC [Croceicoccus marinus]ARU16788.1 LPS export ABC transporter periplasmic protein LptC [Croceicoccus marinus]
MSAEATIVRHNRRVQAAPGGAHDRLIRFLLVALPICIGVLVALMVLAPVASQGEVSFLLDRNRVELTENRMMVDNAMYRGADNSGRPFSVQAGSATQRTKERGLVEMNDLTARLLMNEGPAVLTAQNGTYDLDREAVRFPGAVNFTASDGYRMIARNVSVMLPERRLVGDGRVNGRVPMGTFSADRLEADLQERTVSLIGDARLRMEPGSVTTP